MDHTTNIGTNDATDAAELDSGNQAATKTYSQEEVDNMMARMRGSLEKKLLKPYAELGDPEELRSIKTDWEKQQQAQQIKRGEFEKTLQEMAAKKDAEISKRDSIIQEYRVNSPLLNAAAQYKAVAPEQVKELLSRQVRLNEDGDVEVLDSKGAVRYNDKGEPLGVNDLVQEFLTANPHFVQATPATVNTKPTNTTVTNSNARVDLASLDLTRPDHREIYRQAKLKGQV